jgi:iron complex outermembrane recepter protein
LGSYVELSYGQVQGINKQWESGQNSAFACIRADNAYLPTLTPAARAAITAATGNAAFATFPNQTCGFFPFDGPFFSTGGTVITKNWNPQNEQTVTTDTKVTRAVLGLNGKFGGTWTWDAYYQYGKTERSQIGNGYRTNWRYDFAIDAVIDNRVGSATVGQPICRVTLNGAVPGTPFFGPPVAAASLINGCKPLNPFGSSAASAEGLAYAFGALTERDSIRQDVIAASMTGELWGGWGAGPLAAALGAEYRKDKLVNDAGDLPFAQRTDFGLQYGDTNVTEEFLELEMPLLRDQPAANLLMLNAAVRHAKYETNGGFGTIGGSDKQDITTWKVAAVWDPVEWLRIRGSRSRDIRAAGFRELFYSQSIPAGGFFGSAQNPWINPLLLPPGASASDPAVLALNGNPFVSPEKATTTTIGFVLSPSGWAERMKFSADFYDIELVGGLSLGNAQGNVNDCFAGIAAACALVEFGPGLPGQEANPNFARTNITTFRAIYLNQSPYRTKGIDIAWDYSLSVGSLFNDAPGDLSFRLTASHAMETVVPSGRDVAGQNGVDQGFLSDFASSPDWSGNLIVSYANGPFVGTLQARYVSDGALDLQNPKTDPTEPGYDPTMSFSVSDNTIPSYINLNASASYDLKLFGAERAEVYGTINNLLDRDPPFAGTGFGGTGGTNAIFYDALGRTYRVGIRIKM